jgi:hypothetical protein
MSSIQSFFQHGLAKLFLATGWAKRHAQEHVTWREYARRSKCCCYWFVVFLEYTTKNYFSFLLSLFLSLSLPLSRKKNFIFYFFYFLFFIFFCSHSQRHGHRIRRRVLQLLLSLYHSHILCDVQVHHAHVSVGICHCLWGGEVRKGSVCVFSSIACFLSFFLYWIACVKGGRGALQGCYCWYCVMCCYSSFFLLFAPCVLLDWRAPLQTIHKTSVI